MVRANIERITALQIGIEVYIDNQAVYDVDPADARRLGRELEDRAIIRTVHAPYMDLSPGGVDKDIRRISLEKLKKTIEIGRLLGARGIVCHGGYDRWRFDGREDLWIENSAVTWAEMLKESGDLPVMIENIFEENPSTIVALLDHFKERNLWFCFDTGHFNLFSKVSLQEWLIPLKGRLMEFHIHDNHGKSDEHLPVGQGVFPFRELKHFLKSLNGMLLTAETSGESAAIETVRCAKEFLS